jgi:hypothetical protein
MKTPAPRVKPGFRQHARTPWPDKETWLEPEAYCYPSGGFLRRAYVVLRKNEHNPIELPYGEKRVVLASIPDTAFSIPARLKFKGKTIKGFISSDNIFTFTPEANNCVNCEEGSGCKR